MFGHFAVFADSKTKAVTVKELEKWFKWVLPPPLSVSPVVQPIKTADKIRQLTLFSTAYHPEILLTQQRVL